MLRNHLDKNSETGTAESETILDSFPSLPLAQTHVHLEAAVTPEFLEQSAKAKGIDLPDEYTQKGFAFEGLSDFVEQYDDIMRYIQGPDDWHALVTEYLTNSAENNVIYTDLIVSPAHIEMSGISYEEGMAVIADAIEQARQKTGIQATVSITAVRAPSNLKDSNGNIKKFGPVHAENYAERTIALIEGNPTKYKDIITSFGIAGKESIGKEAENNDEYHDHFRDYEEAFRIARRGGLVARAHAGEGTSPGSIHDAIDYLKIKVLDHGTEAVKDAALVQELKEKGIIVTSTPTSNILLGTIGPSTDLSHHPALTLQEQGVAITLGSDDPVFFDTDIANEYELMAQALEKRTGEKVQYKDLEQFTRAGITMPFIPPGMQEQLLATVNMQKALYLASSKNPENKEKHIVSPDGEFPPADTFTPAHTQRLGDKKASGKNHGP